MSWLEQIFSNVEAAALLNAFVGCVLLVIVVVLLRCWRNAVNAVDRVERELAVYAEASVRVAATVEQVLLARNQPDQQLHTSRRHLLQQARARLSGGESVRSVARGLQLSADEAQLLERTAPGSRHAA